MKNLLFILIALSITSLILLGCSERALRIRSIRRSGEVIKKYQGKEDYFLIMREGNKINKYRVFRYSGWQGGADSELLYSVDTFARVCFTGRETQIKIDCQNIKDDPDLGTYITW